MLNIAVFEKEINKVSLEEVMSELCIEDLKLTRVGDLSKFDHKDFDILIISQDILAHQAMRNGIGEAINEFVYKGGVCWILHQGEGANLNWLPQTLRDVRLENRYLSTPSEAMEYVGPWITNRDHRLWNKPNYIDEGRFVLWDVEIEGKRYRSAATHVLLQKGWDVLARFVDHQIKHKDEAAIVAQASYGNGLFFWTQIFSPQVVWREKIDFHMVERIFEKESWKLFLENILAYFQDHRNYTEIT